MNNRTTRLAPSPTGTLHLGNIRTFLVNWALARQQGWKVVIRMEDLDRQRVRPGDAQNILDTLAWLGIDFDEGPHVQSHDLNPYRAAMRTLATARRAYSCTLTRKQIQAAASAPHRDDQELRFTPDLRTTTDADYQFTRDDLNYRFVVGDEQVHIDDCFAGRHVFHPATEVGDFVIWTRLGVPSYQLAVVVDDVRQGITDVVRGDDLLPSAARQALLYKAMGWNEPRWWHVPLVLGVDGRRLAKRHQDTHVETYRHAGVRPERIIGLMAFWCGICTNHCEMSTRDFLRAFHIDTLAKTPITFTPLDHQWLLH